MSSIRRSWFFRHRTHIRPGYCQPFIEPGNIVSGNYEVSNVRIADGTTGADEIPTISSTRSKEFAEIQPMIFCSMRLTGSDPQSKRSA